MEIKDKFQVKGVVTTRIYDKDPAQGGHLIREDVVENLIVTVGKQEILTLMSGLSTTPFTAIAIGTDNTPPTAADTALNAEISVADGARQTVTPTQQTTTFTNDTIQFDATWTFANPYTVQECGIFDSNTGTLPNGNLLGHALIGPYSFVATNVLEVKYNIIIS